MRHLLRICLLIALCAFFTAGASRGSRTTVRIYLESAKHDDPAFTKEVTLKYAGRKTEMSQMASISEAHIADMRTFQAKDGTWGAYILLGDIGRFQLETLSHQSRGRSIIIFVGDRQIIDLVVDKKIDDGIIVIPFGLKEEEAKKLAAQFGKKKEG